MYQDFASCYDLLMRDVDYDTWAKRCAQLLGPAPMRICECACGTGSLTVPLAKLGYTMTGSDLSQEMLSAAMVKARQAGLQIPFVCQDMRKLQVTRPQDAVLAACDGVNYLLCDEDALRFFGAAFAALKPGGKLIFDISSYYKLKNILGDNTLTLDEEDAAYLWQNQFDDKKRIVSMALTIFVREGRGESFRRVREDQRQRAWQTEEMKELLLKSGFQDIRFFGGLCDRPATEKDERILVYAIKGA